MTAVIKPQACSDLKNIDYFYKAFYTPFALTRDAVLKFFSMLCNMCVK